MMEPALVCNEITPLAQYQRGRLGQLPDQELLASTRRLVGASNQILAELLAHLAEVEARGVHRLRLCTSLYAYCIYELQFSEDAAFRRVSAARLLQKFPVLYDAIASGELHLTGLLQIGPHLTLENLSEVLARSKHRTKKEIAKLVRDLDPLPDVPASIEPLGPVLPQQIKMRNPTWPEYLLMLNPVNHLPPGQRPRDWMSDTPFALVPQSSEPESDENEVSAIKDQVAIGDEPVGDEPVGSGLGGSGLGGSGLGGNGLGGNGLGGDERGRVGIGSDELGGDKPNDGKSNGDNLDGGKPDGDKPNGGKLDGGKLDGGKPDGDKLDGGKLDGGKLDGGKLDGGKLDGGCRFGEGGDQSVPSKSVFENRDAALAAPQRFAVQFTASQEYVDLVERAQALLSHGSKVGLGELHLRAMKALVGELERKKFATKKPRSPRRVSAEQANSHVGEKVNGTEAGSEGAEPESAKAATTSGSDDAEGARSPRRRGRAIPAAVRRAVYERDGLRCTHVDDSGARCAEKHRLQFHHAWAFGRGGEHSVANVTLRCVAHNDLAAEIDFGAERMRAVKDRQRHESLVRQNDSPANGGLPRFPR